MKYEIVYVEVDKWLDSGVCPTSTEDIVSFTESASSAAIGAQKRIDAKSIKWHQSTGRTKDIPEVWSVTYEDLLDYVRDLALDEARGWAQEAAREFDNVETRDGKPAYEGNPLAYETVYSITKGYKTIEWEAVNPFHDPSGWLRPLVAYRDMSWDDAPITETVDTYDDLVSVIDRALPKTSEEE
jgi:hypothetical protein